MQTKYQKNHLSSQQSALPHKRAIIRKEIRRSQLENRKQKQRQLLCRNQPDQPTTQQQSNLPEQITEHILLQQMGKMRQFEDLSAIEEKVLKFMICTESFSSQFRNQFVKMCLENCLFRENPFMLRSVSVLVSKCQNIEVVEQICFQELLQCLLGNNSQKNQQEDQLQEKTLLISCIMTKSKRKLEIIQLLQKYWKVIANLRLMNKQYLKLAAVCCSEGFLYMSPSEIQNYLEFQYSQNENATNFEYLWKIVHYYYTAHQCLHSLCLLFKWMYKIVAIDRISNKVKSQFIELIGTMYQEYSAEAKKQLFQGLVNSRFLETIAKFSGERSSQSLRVLSIQLIGYILHSLSVEQIQYFISTYDLLGILINALDLPFNDSQTLICLQIIFLMVSRDSRNLQIAQRTDLVPKLNMLQWQSNVKISEMASLVLELLLDQE